MRTPSLARALVLFACIALLVAGCTGDDDSPDASAGGGAPTESETTSEPPPPPPPAPRRDRCYRLSADDIAQAHSDAKSVPCKRQHTTQTYSVGPLPKKLVRGGEVESNAIAKFVDERCSARFADHVGGDGQVRTLARVHHVWFVPTEDEIARGAEWFRCDVVADRSGGKPASLPTSTKGMLGADDALDDWGTCDRSGDQLNPEADWRLCSEPHNWRAISTLSVGDGGERWPGRDELVARGDECESTVRDYLDDSTGALSFQWTFPTESQWQAGRRYGLCWTEDA